MSSATTDFIINLNNNNDANKVASIMKEVASRRIPEYENEISKFIAGITVDGNKVMVEENYSLMSCTFCELVPQIMMAIAMNHLGEIYMEAWFTSYNCGYEAEFIGRVYKNGKFKMSFNEHE